MQYDDMKAALEKRQGDDLDTREWCRASDKFVEEPDGQWDTQAKQSFDDRGKPRYSFDKINPIIDQIMGEIEAKDFGIRVDPTFNGTKEGAQLRAGMVRRIQNKSKAQSVYDRAARKCIKSGFDAWRVRADYDGASFDQIPLIEYIPNAVSRVWIDVDSFEPDASDAKKAWVLSAISPTEYEKRWPDGSGTSVSDSNTNDWEYYKPEMIHIGECYWSKEQEVELALLSNGDVVEIQAGYMPPMDVRVVDTRKHIKEDWYSRLFDGDNWLEKEYKLPFKSCPVVTLYGNFDIIDDKIIYKGVIRDLMDAQRVYNYAKSREIEEGALAPRRKIMMTKEQVKGHESTISTMNTNPNPVQTYTHVDGQPAPYETGGPQINPNLANTAQGAKGDIEEGAGMYSAMMGQDMLQRSGTALQKLQDKGDTGNAKWHNVLKRSIERTGQIILEAFPVLYDRRERDVMVMNDFGEISTETLNQQVESDQGYEVKNDMQDGEYVASCVIDAAFKNRQEESNAHLLELAAIDPQIMEVSKDVFLRNVNSPGIDTIADRVRQGMVQQGIIPFDQLTDEEKEKIVQESQEQANQPPDPMIMAVMQQSQSEMMNAQSLAEERQFKAMNEMAKTMQAQEMNQAKIFTELANGLKAIKEATGADAIVAPEVIEAYGQQAELLSESQEEVLEQEEGVINEFNQPPIQQ